MENNDDKTSIMISTNLKLHDRFKRILESQGHQTSGRHSELTKISTDIFERALIEWCEMNDGACGPAEVKKEIKFKFDVGQEALNDE